MIERKTPWFPGKCAGRNSAGGGLTRAAVDMGVRVEYLYPRHTSIVAWMGENHGLKPYTEGGICLMGCAAQTEREVEQFEFVINKYHRRISVIMAPLGLDVKWNLRNQVYIADGSQRGDVLAGVRKVGIKNIVPIHCFVESTSRGIPKSELSESFYYIHGVNPIVYYLHGVLCDVCHWAINKF